MAHSGCRKYRKKAGTELEKRERCLSWHGHLISLDSLLPQIFDGYTLRSWLQQLVLMTYICLLSWISPNQCHSMMFWVQKVKSSFVGHCFSQLQHLLGPLSKEAPFRWHWVAPVHPCRVAVLQVRCCPQGRWSDEVTATVEVRSDAKSSCPEWQGPWQRSSTQPRVTCCWRQSSSMFIDRSPLGRTNASCEFSCRPINHSVYLSLSCVISSDGKLCPQLAGQGSFSRFAPK